MGRHDDLAGKFRWPWQPDAGSEWGEKEGAPDWMLKDTDWQNYWLQEEVFDYEKELQKEIFAREDSAVQRRAADLEAAGLSKTLAAGGGAQAGPVVGVQAPQKSNANMMQKAALMMQAVEAGKSFAQTKLLKAQADLTRQKTQTEVSNSAIKAVDAKIKTALAGIEQQAKYDTYSAINYQKEISWQKWRQEANETQIAIYNGMVAKKKQEYLREGTYDPAKAQILAELAASELMVIRKDMSARDQRIFDEALSGYPSTWTPPNVGKYAFMAQPLADAIAGLLQKMAEFEQSGKDPNEVWEE